MTAERPPAPVVVGATVIVHGHRGVVEAIGWSHAVEDYIVTVACDSRIKVRVRGQDITQQEQPQ